MSWLDQRSSDLVRHADLALFEYAGNRIPLMDSQRGIRKPASMQAALSMRTVFTRPGAVPPYADSEGQDGFLRYKYRGHDPMHPENRALRNALRDKLPLLWFVGVEPGWYLPRYPVWVVDDEALSLQFVIAVDEGQRLIEPRAVLTVESKRYVQSLTNRRLHQPLFRARVLAAYKSRCALCRLGHAELLDAAHIIADGLPHGDPVVPNGLAMCKIHHAAYDKNILGIRPDHVISIREDILAEADGPMLRHGLQAMNGLSIHAPSSKQTRPDRDRLEERYQQFLTTAV